MDTNEIWRDVIGYEGIYKVSNKGNVFSIKSNRNLSLCKDAYGYILLGLSTKGVRKNKKAHRLVAEAFIYNDDIINKTQINHKDEDTTNNNVDNLEWCTPKYNANYGTRNERCGEKTSVPVVSININDRTINHYVSMTKVNESGYDHQGVSMCLSNEINTYKSCIWLELEEYDVIKDDIDGFVKTKIENSYNIKKGIYAINEDSHTLNFDSLRDADRNGYSLKSVKKAINNNTKYKNFNWFFKGDLLKSPCESGTTNTECGNKEEER